MDKLLDWVIKFLNQNDDEMDEEKSEIVRYGLEIVLLKVIFLIATLIVGIIMKSFIPCLAFMILFMPLRTNAGGYHAQTRMQCFIQSMLTVAIVIIGIKYINIYIAIMLLVLTVISLPFIWILSPVDTKNKRLDDEEKVIFKKKTRIILIIEIAVAVICWFAKFELITYTAMFSIIDVALLVVAEHIKNKSGAENE